MITQSALKDFTKGVSALSVHVDVALFVLFSNSSLETHTSSAAIHLSFHCSNDSLYIAVSPTYVYVTFFENCYQRCLSTHTDLLKLDRYVFSSICPALPL